jgi:hypothetical protein
MEAKFLRRDDAGWERIVMGELLIPDTPNCYGDIYTREAIKEFCYRFAMEGYGIDVNHDNVEVGSGVFVVETFIARAGDPDFIEGSWVVAMKIMDDTIWQMVLDGEINGYSYEALCHMLPIKLDNLRNRVVTGVTYPDLIDGHTHTYTVVLDPLNRPLSGGTTVTDGHDHSISTHTYTDFADAHRHRFDVLDDTA